MKVWKNKQKCKLIQHDFEAYRCIFYTVEYCQSFNFNQMMNNFFEKSENLIVKDSLIHWIITYAQSF